MSAQPHEGAWRCTVCGGAPAIADARWRWNGEQWEHKCGDAQAGHFAAVRVCEVCGRQHEAWMPHYNPGAPVEPAEPAEPAGDVPLA